MIDPRSNVVTLGKWAIVAAVGYFMLHPIAGIYEKSDYRDIIFMAGLMATLMGLDVPITWQRKAAWKKEVQEALETPPPPAK